MENFEPDFTDDIIEQLMLKRCLLDKKYIKRLAGIYDKRWIKNEKLRALINIAIAYYNKHGEHANYKTMSLLVPLYVSKHPDLDVTDLNSELCRVGELNVNVSDDVQLKNLDHFILKRGIFWVTSDNMERMEKDGNADCIVNEFNKLKKLSSTDGDLGLNYFTQEGQDEHWEYITNPEAKVKTLWCGIDTETHGGFLKDGRMLALFCGQAGLGKSLYLSNLGYNLLRQNKRVVVISLEMSENVYAKRFSAHISGDNINGLQNTVESSREKINNFYKMHPDANLIIKEYPPRSVRVVDVENYLENLRENGIGFDAVLVDYLNLLLPNSKFDNSYQSMMAVSEQLRALSYKFNVPFFSASQFNREGMDNPNVGMANISDSTGLAFTADFIGLLFQAEGDREHGIINMRLGKNRFGSPGRTIQFHLDPDSLVLNDQTFETHPDEDTEEADNIINNLSQLSGDINTL